MSNLNLKGLWIPIEILTDKNLSDKEKIILSIILFLSKENNYPDLAYETVRAELLMAVGAEKMPDLRVAPRDIPSGIITIE